MTELNAPTAPAHATSPHVAAAQGASLQGLDGLFGQVWPDPRPVERHPRLAWAALVPALLAATVLFDAGVGLATTLVAVMIAALGVAAVDRRLVRGDRPLALLILLLVITGVLTSASWAVALSWLAAALLLMITATRAVSVTGLVGSVVAASLAWLRGLPWLTRSLRLGGAVDRTLVGPVIRTVVAAGLLVLVFGGLFASADGVFAAWLSAIVPSIDLGTAPARVMIFLVVAAVALSLIFLAVLPADVERVRRAARPAVRRFEWAVPVGAVVAVFVVFLTAQASALFGGEAYLQATAGLSHADYVHQGFAQLVAATALVLVVIGTAVRRASRATAADRRWLQLLLGLLCLLALVVAGSALQRLALYDDAFGSSRLRLLVAAFEVWVVVVLLLAGTVCVRLRGDWVPRVAVIIGTTIIAVLTLAGPDRMIADHNVDRFEVSGTVDWTYLGRLSAEAVPAIDRLPEPYRSCALASVDLGSEGVAGRDVATSRARAIMAERPADMTVNCYEVPSR